MTRKTRSRKESAPCAGLSVHQLHPIFASPHYGSHITCKGIASEPGGATRRAPGLASAHRTPRRLRSSRSSTRRSTRLSPIISTRRRSPIWVVHRSSVRPPTSEVHRRRNGEVGQRHPSPQHQVGVIARPSQIFRLQTFCISSTLRRQGQSDLGGSYVETRGLRDLCRLARGAAQRKDQPPHPLRQPRDDRLVEHRGRCPCRAAQSRE